MVRKDKEKEETKKQKAKTDRMKETNFLLTTGEGEFKKGGKAEAKKKKVKKGRKKKAKVSRMKLSVLCILGTNLFL